MFHPGQDGRPLKDFVIKVTVCMRPRMDAGRLVYLFLRAATANYHKLGAQNTRTSFSMVPEAKMLKSCCQQAHAPSAGCRRESSPLPLLALMLQLFPGLWAAPLQPPPPSSHSFLLCCLCLLSLLSLPRTLIIGIFRASSG